MALDYRFTCLKIGWGSIWGKSVWLEGNFFFFFLESLFCTKIVTLNKMSKNSFVLG